MQSVAFAIPIMPGRTDADREAMRSCAEGERKDAYQSSRARHGIARESVWIQPTPAGDVAVVYLEADNMQAAFAGIGSSQDPFDRWFREMTHDIHGISLEEGFPPPRVLRPRSARRPSCGSGWGSGDRRRCSARSSFSELAASGPLAAEQLRQRLDLHERSARDFFDALVSLGMLDRAGGRYANTPATELFLDRAKPTYVGAKVRGTARPPGHQRPPVPRPKAPTVSG